MNRVALKVGVDTLVFIVLRRLQHDAVIVLRVQRREFIWQVDPQDLKNVVDPDPQLVPMPCNKLLMPLRSSL